MADVLSLTIPLGSRYPSKNQEGADGRRGGKKSWEYKQVFDDVKEAAEREMERIGWEKATCECLAIIMRCIPDYRRCDALNIGTAEANALSAAGVWTDDRMAQPCLKHIRHDGVGPHRITICVVKLYEPANQFAPEKPKMAKIPKLETPSKKAPKSTGKYALSPSKPAWKSGDPIPPGYAMMDGVRLVTVADALAMMAGKGPK